MQQSGSNESFRRYGVRSFRSALAMTRREADSPASGSASPFITDSEGVTNCGTTEFASVTCKVPPELNADRYRRLGAGSAAFNHRVGALAIARSERHVERIALRAQSTPVLRT